MIAAETSDTSRGYLLDVKERNTRWHHLKVWGSMIVRRCRKVVEVGNLHRQRCVDSRVGRRGKMSQSAHMKSFSSVGRDLTAVAGSRNEHRCSRIASTC